jgi:hypothetical protein
MEERIAIGLDPQEVMALLRVGFDEDEQEALRCLREIVIPKLEAVRNRIHCRPAYELEAYRKSADPPR